MIRLLLVDDHPVVREGLATVLEDHPDLQVAGGAGTAQEAVDRASALHPNVVLLDLELPDSDGITLIPALLAASRDIRVLVFTAYGSEERITAAMRAGARGYLLKGASAEEIARAVRVVHAGGTYLESGVAAKLFSRDRGTPETPALTDREREVLRLLAEGLPNKQIAHALGITERTVKFHISALLSKLGAESRTQAVRLALRGGLLPPDAVR